MEYIIAITIFGLFSFRCFWVLSQLQTALRQLPLEVGSTKKIMEFDKYFWQFWYWGLPIKKEYRE